MFSSTNCRGIKGIFSIAKQKCCNIAKSLSSSGFYVFVLASYSTECHKSKTHSFNQKHQLLGCSLWILSDVHIGKVFIVNFNWKFILIHNCCCCCCWCWGATSGDPGLSDGQSGPSLIVSILSEMDCQPNIPTIHLNKFLIIKIVWIFWLCMTTKFLVLLNSVKSQI